MYLNKAIVYGNLTRDPEVRALPSGVQVASFSVATNRVYKDKDGNKKEQADFHNIVLFARLAELAGQYLKKGSGVLIEGRMQTRSWDAEGGKKYRTEIVAESMQFGPRGSGSTGGAGPSVASAGDSAPKGKDSKAKGAGKADGAAGAAGQPDGGAIEYPDEEINPDDIPF